MRAKYLVVYITALRKNMLISIKNGLLDYTDVYYVEPKKEINFKWLNKNGL